MWTLMYVLYNHTWGEEGCCFSTHVCSLRGNSGWIQTLNITKPKLVFARRPRVHIPSIFPSILRSIVPYRHSMQIHSIGITLVHYPNLIISILWLALKRPLVSWCPTVLWTKWTNVYAVVRARAMVAFVLAGIACACLCCCCFMLRELWCGDASWRCRA